MVVAESLILHLPHYKIGLVGVRTSQGGHEDETKYGPWSTWHSAGHSVRAERKYDLQIFPYGK